MRYLWWMVALTAIGVLGWKLTLVLYVAFELGRDGLRWWLADQRHMAERDARREEMMRKVQPLIP